MIYGRLGAQSKFTSNSIAIGGSIVRNNVAAILEGEGSECTLNGLSLGTASQLVDNHTTIDHVKPNCASHELYKSILDGGSRGVFNGKILYAPRLKRLMPNKRTKRCCCQMMRRSIQSRSSRYLLMM